ncbi:FecR domain-containing protein [Acidovorax sp. K2F]|uniref:FecR domain-containing protein n=1 Tax=Acidovorax sp. K2F TaxID=2978125 RepID=UPI0021B1352E|nr:FecR domain-containing protein [Acidovorax sp. K2F]MCT6718114.1 FecR domain-containing protein [Acidovorax sp. K2F]
MITPLPFRMHSIAAALLCVAATTAFSAQPVAAPSVTQLGDEIAHAVKEGDTLEGLARSYLANPRQWPLLQARNKVADPKRLQPGSLIFIPVRLQPSESATVQFVQGEVTAQARGSGTPAPIATGSKLEEGTELKVGPESFVAVQLADGTVVRVQAQSELQLRQLRRRGRAGSVQSVLEMHKGGVESTVPPSAEPLRRMEIRTPLAVTSVRGTQFSVALADSGQTTASVEHGSVAVQSRRDTDSEPGAALKAPTALLAPGQGLAVATDGTVGAPRPLLPAPDTSGMPTTLGDAGLLAIDLPMASGATRYVAQVAQDPAFTQVLRHGSFPDGRLRWKALDDGRYYLAVRALDDAGIAGLPAVQPFTVKTRPVAPLYQHPAPGAVVPSGAAELRCTEVPGVRWYRVQVAVDAQFTQPLRDEQRLTECRLPLGALPAGSYFWRIASLLALPDGQADQGPFAPPQPFTVADRPTALSLQALQAEDGDPTVRLHWPAQAGQRFRLQRTVATDLDFAKVAEDTVLDAPTWTASNLAASEYLVRIQVLDASGLESDFSPPRKIRVGTGIRTGAGLPVSTSSGTPVGRP